MLSSEVIRRLPKVQLHCHLEGTVSPKTFRDLAARNGIDIGLRGRVPLDETYTFASFREFLRLFADVCKVLRTPDDFGRIACEYAADAAEHGVVYAELFVSPSVWTYFNPALNVRAAVSAIRRALEEAHHHSGVEIALIADLTRNFGAARALASVHEAVALRDLGIIGVGIGGDEATYPASLFVDAYAAARKGGLRTVAHAGEAAGPESIRSALDDLGAERIGHGIRAISDPELISELARRRIPLEICPTSNRMTGALAPSQRHPLADFDRAGILCVIDVDDPALFGTNICDEYALTAELAGSGGVMRFARNAIAASFAPDVQKKALTAKLDVFEAEAAQALANAEW